MGSCRLKDSVTFRTDFPNSAKSFLKGMSDSELATGLDGQQALAGPRRWPAGCYAPGAFQSLGSL